jgi:hypothetical protein
VRHPETFQISEPIPPYQRMPKSRWRVKLDFRVEFDNGGHLEGEGFLLDLVDERVAPARAAEMLVSALNLLRAGSVTIRGLEVVRRGDHDDA